MSLESKLAFLFSVKGVIYSVAGTAVTLTVVLGSRKSGTFIEVLKNPKWSSIACHEITSLTLVGFSVQADDHDSYGSRWCINWFNSTYPGKFFMTHSTIYHIAHDNEDGSYALDRCNNYCDHGLHFGTEGDVTLLNS